MNGTMTTTGERGAGIAPPPPPPPPGRNAKSANGGGGSFPTTSSLPSEGGGGACSPPSKDLHLPQLDFGDLSFDFGQLADLGGVVNPAGSWNSG